MTCTHCGAAVPEDAERCPKCLRRSGVVAADESSPAPSEKKRKRKQEPKEEKPAVPDTPQRRALRAAVTFAATIAIVTGAYFASRQLVPREARPIERDGGGPVSTINVRSSKTKTADEHFVMNLTVDGGDFESAFGKLRMHLVKVAIPEVKRDAAASGHIRVFVPARFQTPERERQVAEEEKTARGALEQSQAKTPGGAQVRVTFEFGTMPN